MTPDLLRQRAKALRRWAQHNSGKDERHYAGTCLADADYMDQAADAMEPPQGILWTDPTDTLPRLLAEVLRAHGHVSSKPGDKLIHCWVSELEKALADIAPRYLFERTKHGDARHQGWLMAAFQCVFRGQPVPEPVHTCHVCGGPTQMACSDCRINFGASVHVCSKPECRKAHDELCAGDTARKQVIQLTPAEIQSGLDRVRFAELLIKQLPANHDGRNTWLLNYGAKP